MKFSQEDLNQIEQWLKSNSIKDSQFESLDQLNQEDIVVIVHEGMNYKIPISKFIELGLSYAQFQNLPTTNKTIVGAINELTIASGQFPEAPIDGNLYGRKDGEWEKIEDSNSYLELYDKVNQLLNKNFEYKLEASPSVIFQGSNSLINLKATSSDNSDIDIFNNTVKLTSGENIKTLQFSLRISNTTQFKATFKYLEETKNSTATVTAVNPIYYGASLTNNYVFEDLIKYPNAVNSPNREYTVDVSREGDSIYFLVPSNMTINKANLGGVLEFPISLIKTESLSITTDSGQQTVQYKVYKSDNKYEIGNLKINIL